MTKAKKLIILSPLYSFLSVNFMKCFFAKSELSVTFKKLIIASKKSMFDR